MEDKKDLIFNLSISRASCSFRKDFIQIEFEDRQSGISVLRVEIDMEDFTKCLTGLSAIPTKVKYFLTERCFNHLNKKREIKNVTLPYYAWLYTATEEELVSFIEKTFPVYINEGWMVWDTGKHRRQDSSTTWSAILYRFVDLDEE